MAFTPSKKLTNCDFHISIDNEHFVRDEGDKFSRSNFGCKHKLEVRNITRCK